MRSHPPVLAAIAASAGLAVFATGAVKANIPWRWWEASGSELMLLGLGLLAMASVLRAR